MRCRSPKRSVTDRLETLEAFAERFIRARKEGGNKGKKLMGSLQRDWQEYQPQMNGKRAKAVF